MKNHTLTAPGGFRVGAVKSGLKTGSHYDLGLIVADQPCAAAAVFTTNKVVGPAVTVSREHIRGGKAQAVFVNAGNANTCTGKRGFRDALTICGDVADQLDINPRHVLVCSTGIIGHFLPMDKIRRGITNAVGSLGRSAKLGTQFAQAIMTTDLQMKTAWRQIKVGGKTVTVAAAAKGSGMIAPNMATMLAFVTTDAVITSARLGRAFKAAATSTFNKVSVDTHTSTSDTAIVLASGCAGNRPIRSPGRDYEKFAAALHEVCDDLARKIAADGEGATCMITVSVAGAASAADARASVRAIVDSPLVRCAFHGADPNWGRIISAVGYSGARFNPAKISCKIADTFVFRSGRPCDFNPAVLSKKMKAKQWDVHVDLGAGRFEDFCYACDLTAGYVKINAHYHT
jgi:glutamate N-acetyltransferase / amino-acid N-acetyltransferase